MEEKSGKKHKKSKKNGVSDAGICEAEQGGKYMVIEGCKSSQKEAMDERKNDEGRDEEQKKKVREDSNEGIVESKKANERGEIGEFTGAEDYAENVNKNVEKKKKKKKKKRDKDKTVGGSGHKVQEINFEDAKADGQSTVSETCGNMIEHEKEVETVEKGSNGDPVGTVGKKKSNREYKVELDEDASQQDVTQLTESGKQDGENKTGEYLEEFEEGGGKKIVEKAEKKKRKREEGKEMDGSAAANAGVLAKENNQGRADSTVKEEEENNVKNGNIKGKSKKEKSVENGS